MNRFLQALRLLIRSNWLMTLATLALIVIGVFFVYSASYAREEAAVQILYLKQIVWALAGFACYAGMALFDYRRLREGAWWFYGLALILLVVVLLVGTKIYGAKRWLMFLGAGIQPSELAKLAIILCAAAIMSRPGMNCARPVVFWGVLGLAVVPGLLILKEPDLGTALILAPVVLVMLYVGGASGKHLALLIAVGVLAVGSVLGALLLPERLGWSEEKQAQYQRWTGLSPYQRNRLLVFMDSDRDPLGAGWNKMQSEIAVGSGGLTGKGFLNGTQNILGFLPRTVAPTDFIFSVITEEKGFVGSVTVLGLFAVVFLCGLQAAVMANDKLGRLLCVGIMTMLFSHVVVNVSMTVGLMPIAGLPLPLISYGGTFMMSTMAALGVVQSVYIRRVGL